MGRGLTFTPSEDDFLTTNAENKTAKELFELHQEVRKDMAWPERSAKSLARRVERLREMGELDVRTEETRRKAYYGRNRALRGE
jgi:hypothetical protein